MKRKPTTQPTTPTPTDDDDAIVEMLQPGPLPGDEDPKGDDEGDDHHDELPPAAAEAPPAPAPKPAPAPVEPAPAPAAPGPAFLRVGPLRAFRVRPGEWRTQGHEGAPSVAVVAQGGAYQGTASLGQLGVASARGATPEGASAALESAVGVSGSVAARRFREAAGW